MTARQDFTISAGRDYALSVALSEADQRTPLNLTDCEIEWVIAKASSQIVMINKSSLDPEEIEIVSASEGIAIIHLAALDTENYGNLTCEHEMVVTDVNRAEATVMRGLITILRSIIT